MTVSVMLFFILAVWTSGDASTRTASPRFSAPFAHQMSTVDLQRLFSKGSRYGIALQTRSTHPRAPLTCRTTRSVSYFFVCVYGPYLGFPASVLTLFRTRGKHREVVWLRVVNSVCFFVIWSSGFSFLPRFRWDAWVERHKTHSLVLYEALG